jgi:hypothetical protein
MSNAIKVAVLIVAVLVWLPAQAQLLGLGVETNIALTKQDLAIIRQTVNRQVHGQPVGTTAKWSNPASVQFRQGQPRQEVHAQQPAMRNPRLSPGDNAQTGGSIIGSAAACSRTVNGD